MKTLKGSTRVIGIIGDPINHSLSPIMQNAAFAAGNLDYVYVPFAVSSDNLEQAVLGLKALGVCGFNVTIPHKTAIIPFLNNLDESAKISGAVNTVLMCGSNLVGYNTDGDGLIDSLANDVNFFPGGDRILVIGAGGAARGAIAALCRNGAQKISICNRSIEKARTVMFEMNDRYPETEISVISHDQLSAEELNETSLLLNTTSLGMKGERMEYINLCDLPRHAKVYDMVYSRSGTPLVIAAEKSGFQAANGLGMLIAQGERAFEIWTGKKPLEGVMRRALSDI